jgi:hypothetical protein
MSENTNNEKTVVDAEVSTPVVEEPKAAKPEPVKVEEPKIEEAPAAEPEVVVAPEAPVEKPGIGIVGDGAMGVTTVKEKPKREPIAKPVASKEDTVAIYSSRNVNWQGVGKVVTGYNIVSKAAADQWATRDHIRIATPQEVAGEFKN